MGSLWQSLATGIPRFITDRTGQFFFGPANEAVQNILTNASLDPGLALRLMRDAQYTPRAAFSDVLRENMLGYGGVALRTPGLMQPARERERR